MSDSPTIIISQEYIVSAKALKEQRNRQDADEIVPVLHLGSRESLRVGLVLRLSEAEDGTM